MVGGAYFSDDTNGLYNDTPEHLDIYCWNLQGLVQKRPREMWVLEKKP